MTGAPKPEDVRSVYDRKAVPFGAHRRNSTMEVGWLKRFASAVPTGSEVLDLGCGTGDPVARWLLEQGFAVTGADFSTEMLRLARSNFPDALWVEADMRRLNLGRGFDGIIAWHSFFHLTVAEQRAALPLICDHLRPGGVLMMTLGTQEGEAHGHVDGDIVYHASLDDAEYRAILHTHGVAVEDFVHNDQSCGGTNVLFARRRG